MNKKIAEIAALLSERERLVAYGLHSALALVDAEIARLTADERGAAEPAGRTAPPRQTATSSRKSIA